MARSTVIIDDIDGSPEAEPFPFQMGGVAYTIDLAAKNRDKLVKAMAPFLARATTVRPERVAAAKRNGSVAVKRAERDYDLVELRHWAARSGIALPARGRIPQAIVDEFRAGHA